MYRVIIYDNKATYPNHLGDVIERRSFNNLDAAINFYVDKLLVYKVKAGAYKVYTDDTTSIDCELVKIDGINGNHVLDHRVFYITCE